MLSNFFNGAWNAGKAILIWGLIAFAVLELGGCVYVNFFQHDPNDPIDPPSVDRAQYEVYVKANNRYLYSDDVEQVGSVVTLKNYYALYGDNFRYVKATIELDEENFGDIEVTKRQ